MMRGTRSIYVDYVDFDEVAHHAGVTRLEALSTLTALDEVIAILERVAQDAPRRYRFVLLSDHGQSQGEPFASRYGIELSSLCAQLMDQEVDAVEHSVESWGRLGSMVDDLGAGSGVTGRAARSLGDRVEAHAEPEPGHETSSVVVLGSGNLGSVYVPGSARLSLEEIQQRWPALVAGLVAHPGIGFVAALSAKGPVAIGPAGSIELETGVVHGTSPLLSLRPHAREVLRRAVLMPEAPELYVNSAFDSDTGEVAAFEELVGCHGGLGGWQDSGMLLAPADLMVPDVEILGADDLHRHLVAMLVRLGHRGGTPAPAAERPE
jgi:hypothetical protein